MTPRRPDLDRAAAEWLSELRGHRQPWAEWDALEAVVATSSWSVVELYRGPSASPWHLTTGSDGSRALWRLVPDTDERVERRRALETAGCPAWVEPLLDVGWSSPGFGGAIGEALTGSPVDATWLAANEAYTGVCAPRSVSPPLGPVFTLQGTEHGAPMLFTSGLEVFVVDAVTARFELVGPLDAFVRHVLRAILDGASWSERLRAGAPTELRWPASAAGD